MLHHIGGVYATLGLDTRALTYLNRALTQSRDGRSPLDTATTMAHIAKVYEKRKEFGRALTLHHEALQIRQQPNITSAKLNPFNK